MPTLKTFSFHRLLAFFSDKRLSEVFSGSAWALIARVFTAGLGLILSIVVSRFYGAAMVGILAVLQSFLVLATIFTVLGTNTSILRLIPEHVVKYSPLSAFRLYRKTQGLVVLVSIATGILFFLAARPVAARMFSKPHLAPYFAGAAVFIVFKSLMLLNTQAVRGLRLIRTFAFMQIMPTGANLLILLALPLFYTSPDNPVFALLASFAVTGIVGWIIMEAAFRRQIKSTDSVHKASIGEILAISIPMLMTATMSFIIGQTATILIAMFRTEAEVGYFSIAVKLATLTAFALGAINTMAGPKFSELYHSGNLDELFYVAQKSAKLAFWVTTPILLVLLVLGRPLLVLFYGEDFAAAYPPLIFLVIGQFVNSSAGCTSMFMNMTGHERLYGYIILGSAVLNIAMNLWLIPSMGITGAALAGMVSVSLLNLSTVVFTQWRYGRNTGYLPLCGTSVSAGVSGNAR